MIEPIIHQIWHPFTSSEMPREWQRFIRSWQRWHPGHEHRLWGAEESRRFVAEHYPDFLPTYDGYDVPIKQVDSLRVMLLHHFGGMYADLDVECLRTVVPLIEGRRIVIPAEPPRHSAWWQDKGFKRVLSTAFMASESRHPFWRAVLEEMKRTAHLDDVMDSTGPFVVTRCYEREDDPTAFTIASPDTIYPVDEPECRDLSAYDLEYWVRKTGDAFAVHHWAGSWTASGLAYRPVLRPYAWGMPTKLRHPVFSEPRPGELFDTGPLVSCIMVTRGWKEPARWSIQCFRNQTYRNRELVVATTNGDGDLQEYLQALRDPRIRFVGVLPQGTSLGAQRNHAVAHASGEFLATWDDDDLFGADRLAAGMSAIMTFGRPAAFLERITIWWPARQELVISNHHHWENTMIAHRSVLPPYPEMDRSEDSTAVAQMVAKHSVITIDDPNLFLYVFNGKNTWGPDHFQKFLDRATFAARGLHYERALSLVQKHVPVLEYLDWLQRRDPRAFDPVVSAPAQLDAVEPAATWRPARAARARTAEGAVSEAEGGLRFCLASELGSGLGASIRLAQIARVLLDGGHEVDLVLHDLACAHAALEALMVHPRLRLFQAPHWAAQAAGGGDPAALSEVLFRVGYLDHHRLDGLVEGWDHLLRHSTPDLLLAHDAPTSLLAARAHDFPRASVGTGFYEPVREAPSPSFRDWEPIPRHRLARAEELAMETCNSILASRRLPPLRALHELFDCDDSFLTTVAELDPVARRALGSGPVYWGTFSTPSQGRPAQWPKGQAPAIFAHLKAEYAPVRAVLGMLASGPWSVLACVPGLPPAQMRESSTSNQHVTAEPVDMTEALRSCEVVVCHAGAGTVGTALQAGKPVVMLPTSVEEYLQARRVQAMGAGVVVLGDRTEHLPEALQQVLQQPAFREAAQAFARRLVASRLGSAEERIGARCIALARGALAERRSRRAPARPMARS